MNTLPMPGYDLLTSSGIVRAFGGASWWGSANGRHLNAPMVSMSVTLNGRGYWLAGSDGGVFSFGQAHFYGSLGAKKRLPGHSIIQIVGTPDARGYWLIDASGVVTPFGDATHIGALPAGDVRRPIVGAAISSDAKGAWFTNAAGAVYALGTASLYGSLASTALAHPVTAMAETPDGKGYWLTESNGEVFSFGDAVRATSLQTTPSGSIVGIIPANALGYWETTSYGSVLPGGDAVSKGGTNGYLNGSPIVTIASAHHLSPTTPATPYPSGSVGYDVNWPQCAQNGSAQAGTLPGPPSYSSSSMKYTVAIVGVDGWAVDASNSCLAAEVSWARQAHYAASTSAIPPYELYLFLNSPASTSTIDQSGPAGTCSSFTGTKWEYCLAYNYGYNAARLAVQYADSAQAHSSLWWLDVENAACAPGIYNNGGSGEFWSCNQALNSTTIQGAIDELRHAGITPGIYSTSQQYGSITGNYIPHGAQIPIWIAGAYWTSPPYPTSYGYSPLSANRPLCATSNSPYLFANGRPVLLQETPGNNYPFDPDYSC